MNLKTVRQSLVTSLVLFTLTVVGTSLSLAGKPTGGGSGSTSGGTIYFNGKIGSTYYLQTMNSDGSGKTALPLNVGGTPSRLLHGGHRWFLASRAVADETYPNGYYRYEQIALRDDGNENVLVQLTDDPDLQLLGRWDWAPGENSNEGMISGFGRRWVFDGIDWGVDPDSVGIYTATVLFDGQGDVIGLEAPPAFLASVGVVAGDTPGTWYPDAYDGFDWSPDLTEIVYNNDDWTELRILDLITGETRTLTTGGGAYHARWSPAGNLIVFGNSAGSIETINPDGTGRKEIIRWGVSYGYYYPTFSPTGSHILYNRTPHGSLESDLYRATPSGSNKINLTSSMAGYETARGWR